MKSLLKLLATIGKSFGISSPSDNARKTPPSWKQPPNEKTSAPSDSSSKPGA